MSIISKKTCHYFKFWKISFDHVGSIWVLDIFGLKIAKVGSVWGFYK